MLSAVIFDLDGVIVSTDELHYRAWKALADDVGVHFDRAANEHLRGVSRMACLSILLGDRWSDYSEEELLAFADTKNERYRGLLTEISPADILPGAAALIEELKADGVRVAIGSSSKNTPTILDRIGMAASFDAVADGNDITKSKPDPEVFLIAAKKLALHPADCLVIEDAVAGIDAALAAGMTAFGVGSAAGYGKCHGYAATLETVTAETLAEVHARAGGAAGPQRGGAR